VIRRPSGPLVPAVIIWTFTEDLPNQPTGRWTVLPRRTPRPFGPTHLLLCHGPRATRPRVRDVLSFSLPTTPRGPACQCGTPGPWTQGPRPACARWQTRARRSEPCPWPRPALGCLGEPPRDVTVRFLRCPPPDPVALRPCVRSVKRRGRTGQRLSPWPYRAFTGRPCRLPRLRFRQPTGCLYWSMWQRARDLNAGS
jgi:hypothetical protein